MYRNAYEIFDDYSNFTVDKKFCYRVLQYVNGFINKNHVHSQAFGSHILGAHPVRFMSSDANQWIEELLGIEEPADCQLEIWNLKEFDKNHKRVASDIVNLSFLYVTNRIWKAKDLKTQDKEIFIKECLIMIQAKHMSSILKRRFNFPSDPLIAQQLYESLDYKSHLKQKGSFIEMLRYHADTWMDMDNKGSRIKARSELYNAIYGFSPDEDVVGAENTIRTTLNKQFNFLTEKFHEMRRNQEKINIRATITEIDGEQVLADYVNNEAQLVRDMMRIIRDPRDFIRDELIDHTCAIINTVDERWLRKVLDYLSDNITRDVKYTKAVKDLIAYMLKQAREDNLDVKDISGLIKRLSSIMRSSQTRKQNALILKAEFVEIVEDAIPAARDAIRTASVIGTVVYIAIRALTIKHYK